MRSFTGYARPAVILPLGTLPAEGERPGGRGRRGEDRRLDLFTTSGLPMFDGACGSFVLLILIGLLLLWANERAKVRAPEREKRIDAWCEWMKTLDGLPQGHVVCRNEVELWWAREVWCMTFTVQDIPGLGTVVRKWTYDD